MDTKDYIRIESALTYLAQRAESQPALADVATPVGLSEHHLQRVFPRWAGINHCFADRGAFSTPHTRRGCPVGGGCTTSLSLSRR